LFIFDSVQITCLVQSVFFIRHGWQKRTESYHKILFQNQSTCDPLVLVQKAYGNEALSW